jgi:predicted nucleotidyltransferase
MPIVNSKPMQSMQYMSFEWVIHQMEYSGHVFYLTGSRAFGGARIDSDWDYFTENTDEVVSLLKQLNFVEISNMVEYHRDNQISRVFELVTQDAKHIQVQLVRDVIAKNEIQDTLLNGEMREVLLNTPKDQRSIIWNLAYDGYMKGKHRAYREQAEERARLKKQQRQDEFVVS